MFGSNFWLGSAELCETARNGQKLDISQYAKHKMNISLWSARTPFAVDYQMVHLEHNSPYQIDPIYGYIQPVLHIGLCLPADCDSQEVMRLVSVYLESDLFLNNDLYELKPHVLNAKSLKPDSVEYHKLICFQLLAGIGIFTLLMTLCAYRLRRRPNELNNSNATAPAQHTGKNLKNSKDIITNSLDAFIRCYDIQLNWSKILAAPALSTKPFAFLDGARIICALVTTYYHTFALLNPVISNVPQLFTYVNNFGNMEVAMDVFLLVSGFLQVYTFLKNESKIESIRRSSFTKSILEIIKTVFHRYLRLAPLYYFIICVSYLTLHYLDNTTLFHYSGALADTCEMYWWRNVLFIHNLFHYQDLCLIWTWHLSCEMQYSIVLTTLLVINAKHPKFAKTSTLLLIIGSLIYQAIAGIYGNYQITLESTFANFNGIYMNPLARIFAHLIGAFTGWLYMEYNSKIRAYALWNGFFSLSLYIGFIICAQAAPFGRNYEVGMATFLMIFQRCMFVLTGCWSILVMVNRPFDWLRRLLSTQFLQRAYQFSYAISLLNSLLIIYIFCYGSKVVYADPIRMAVIYLGLVIILYVLAVPLALFFEMPYRNISNLLTKRNVEKNS